MKPAGGVSTTKAAQGVLVLVKETLGDAWLTPDLLPHRRLVGAQRPAGAVRQDWTTGRYGRAGGLLEGVIA